MLVLVATPIVTSVQPLFLRLVAAVVVADCELGAPSVMRMQILVPAPQGPHAQRAR